MKLVPQQSPLLLAFLVLVLSCMNEHVRANDTYMAIDFQKLKSALNASDISDPHARFQIQLKGESPVYLRPNWSSTINTLQAEVICGPIHQESSTDGGWFVIARAPDGIEGTLWTPTGTWKLSGTHDKDSQGPTQVVISKNPEHEGTCSGSLLPEPLSQPHIKNDPVNTDRGSGQAPEGPTETVRVLVVYDEVAASSTGSIAAYVTAMIGSANFAYFNSGVAPLQLQLAGLHLIDTPTTTDSGLIIRQLTDRFDQVADQAHTLRDAYDADLVAQLVNIPSFCGSAWLSPTNNLFGFSVSDMDCALSNLTFAHELGHNFGCAHDPDNASNSFTSYGYGHRWNSNQWRSVMAYPPGSRVPHFSNPLIQYESGDTGIADQRDNARLLNFTDQTVASMRSGNGDGIDCNANLYPDRLDIALDPTLDLDQDGQIDSCQIASNPSLDCDSDGTLDSEQASPRMHHIIGSDGPFGNGTFLSMSTPPLPEPNSMVTITVAATGDLSSSTEFVTLNFNGSTLLLNAFITGGSDCYSPGLTTTFTVTPEEFSAIASLGVNLQITTSTAVSPTICTNTVITVTLDYRTFNLAQDADSNGVLDLCQADCPADLNGDGVLDFFDISTFLTAYSNQDLIADFSGDGVLDFFDISAFLTSFSMGCP